MFALALLLAAAAPDASSLKIAVYELEARDIDPVLARVVTDAVVAELRKLQGLDVVAFDEVRAMLDMEAQKQLVGCSDESCLAEIAEALGVDAIAIGNLAKVGDQTVFGLKVIDQRKATIVGQYTQRLAAASGEECLAAVGPAIEKLFPDRPLIPGQTRGVAPEIALRLSPPPLDPWLVWTGAGVAGAAVVVAAGALAVNGLAYGAALTSTEGSIGGPAVDGKELSATIGAVRGSFWTAIGATGAAVALGAATAVSALFTDWHGYRAMNEAMHEGPAAAPAPPPSSVAASGR
jgi:TolB-like protein